MSLNLLVVNFTFCFTECVLLVVPRQKEEPHSGSGFRNHLVLVPQTLHGLGCEVEVGGGTVLGSFL